MGCLGNAKLGYPGSLCIGDVTGGQWPLCKAPCHRFQVRIMDIMDFHSGSIVPQNFNKIHHGFGGLAVPIRFSQKSPFSRHLSQGEYQNALLNGAGFQTICELVLAPDP